MSDKEKKLNVYNSEIIDKLQQLRDEAVLKLESEKIKKGTRKRLRTRIRMIDKIDDRMSECLKSTGGCDGLMVTIAKGRLKSRKMKCADYIVSQIIDSKQLSRTFGTSKSRFEVTYLPTYDSRLYIEDTQNQFNIQDPRKIRLVGIIILNERKTIK